MSAIKDKTTAKNAKMHPFDFIIVSTGYAASAI
jgi:hypothetical protein